MVGDVNQPIQPISLPSMKLKNTTNVPESLLREVIRFVCPSSVTRIKIEVRNAANVHGGASWTNARRVGLRFDLYNHYPRWIRPYQYGQLKGRRYWLGSLVDHIVYIAAHELRHQWQDKTRSKAGYVWGARGRHSEIDADSYAIKMLRQWRRERGVVHVDLPRPKPCDLTKPKRLGPHQRLRALADACGAELDFGSPSPDGIWVGPPSTLCDADGVMDGDPFEGDGHTVFDYHEAKKRIEAYAKLVEVKALSQSGVHPSSGAIGVDSTSEPAKMSA